MEYGELIAEFPAREVELVELLQIHPKIGTHSEILTEPQRSIAGNPPAPAQNVDDTGRRHLDRARQFARTDAQLLQVVGKSSPG
jgi:hypothetical protein